MSLTRQIFLSLVAAFLIPVNASPTDAPVAYGSTTSTSTATLASTQAAVQPLAHVDAIRLRQSGDGLRVIVVLSAPAPYTITPDLTKQRVQLDLIQTGVDFLPAELSNVSDPRLSGIWLLNQQPGLLSLELRLPVRTISVEHFALESPPTIIIDLARTDQSVTALTPKTHEFKPSATPAPTPEIGIALQKGGSVLPMEWLTPATTETQSIEPSSKATGEPFELASVTSEALGVMHLNNPVASGHEVTEADLHPINRDFDDFPIHALEVDQDTPKEIQRAFLNRQWGEVITKGINYLKDKRINQDTVYVLHMLAEARYQLGAKQAEPPVGEQLNYYQQAHQMSDAGELGAFAALRIAELSLALRDGGAALAMARQAVQSSDPPVRRRSQIALVRAHAAAGDLPSALQALAAARQDPALTKDQQLQWALLEGKLRYEQNDPNGAWLAYERAFELDPGWVSLDPVAGEQMARAALATGHPDMARKHLEFINRTFSFRDDSQKVALALLYAQALEQLGDLHTAEETYALLLDEMGDTPKGREVQKLMLQLHPEELLASGSNYAALLFRRGKLQQAMAELHKSYQQALRTGLDARQLDPLIEQIVPPYMIASVRSGQPFEAIQAWRNYGGRLRDPLVRDKCLWPLAQALGQIGLTDEALALVNRLKEIQGDDDLKLKRLEVDLLLGMERDGEALEILNQLVGYPAATATPADQATLYRQLAHARLQAGDALGAAQSLQLLARTPGLAADEVGSTLVKAGSIFLLQGMPVQAIELGLQGVVFEQEQLKRGMKGVHWSPQTSQALLLMLARAYEARNDHGRAALVLTELLARPESEPDQTAEARWLLARAQRTQGHRKQAIATLDLLLADNRSPALWRTAAAQAKTENNWDLTHPNWVIQK